MGDFKSWTAGPTDAQPPEPPVPEDKTRLLRFIAWVIVITGLGLCAVLWSMKGN